VVDEGPLVQIETDRADTASGTDPGAPGSRG
jgi:hypothetical protein